MTRTPLQSKPFDLSYAVTLAAVFISGFASAGLMVIKPLIVGALIDHYHFTPSKAGFVAGIEMAGIGIAAFIVAAFGGAWNRRLVMMTGATIGILGSLVPIFMESYWPILVARLLAGMGSGFIASIVLATIGTTRDPDRTFGLYYMLTYFSSALMMPAGLWAITHYAVPGGYALLAVVLAIVYVTAWRIPAAPPTLIRTAGSAHLPPFPLMSSALVLGVSLCFWMGMGGVWAFVERLAGAAGMDTLDIGSVLSIGPLFSVAGAFTASVLHTRFGRFPILVATVATGAAGTIMVGIVHQPLAYTVGVLAISYIWPMFLAYLGGAMSAIDPSGRVIAMSVTSQTIGMAVGPAFAGVIAGRYGYEGIAVLGLVCFMATFPLMALLHNRNRTALPAE